jgi:hypothetical protein
LYAISCYINFTFCSLLYTDFADDAELQGYVRTAYDKAVGDDTDLVMCVQTMVLVTRHYMIQAMRDSPQVGGNRSNGTVHR